MDTVNLAATDPLPLPANGEADGYRFMAGITEA